MHKTLIPAKAGIHTQPHFESADDFYEALLAAHQGLTTEQSHALNARLVLLLANHIGSNAVLSEALAAARNSHPREGGAPQREGECPPSRE
ncbi:MAG: DUF2783 domain-containing protein [Cytophagales bacterium]|nr:DUF2783 domain-containing protein [Cytophagales bacterium]